jgi:hypothetical protein
MISNKPYIKLIAFIAFMFGFIVVSALPIGCAIFYQPKDPVKTYYDQIKDWQDRVKQEGWSEKLIDDVIYKCHWLAFYQGDEIEDHWDTPSEFEDKGLKGDCEDIAVFLLATFKRLKYPFGVRILAVRTLVGDHALLKVKMPDGKWKTYETVPMPLGFIDGIFYFPLFEWDFNRIYELKKN